MKNKPTEAWDIAEFLIWASATAALLSYSAHIHG
jgi:hypothetical protein